jgi:hypothetical protein
MLTVPCESQLLLGLLLHGIRVFLPNAIDTMCVPSTYLSAVRMSPLMSWQPSWVLGSRLPHSLPSKCPQEAWQWPACWQGVQLEQASMAANSGIHAD